VDGAPERKRRARGQLKASVLAVLRANPDQPMTNNQLAKAVDASDAGTGLPKASAGAVANVVTDLIGDGKAVEIAAKPATTKLAPSADGGRDRRGD
jgi:hypothetical protein